VTASLYATIWTALVLFAAAETGRSRFADQFGPARWARPALGAGALLLVLHVLIALHLRYGWDHELAVRETARQAATVYGFEWRGNIFVSYAFVLLWCAEVVWWRSRPPEDTAAARVLFWAWRGFFFVVIANGAVVFAMSPIARVAGGLLVAALVWAWWPTSARSRAHG
jgi:hypothetical protein